MSCLLILEIYLNDTVTDWVKGCAKRGDEGNESLAGWEPARRINLAKRKLQTNSPVDLLLEELSLNPRCVQFKSLQHLDTIIRSNRVADVSDRKLTVPEQVDELIGLASDPNILVRQWCGLLTWI